MFIKKIFSKGNICGQINKEIDCTFAFELGKTIVKMIGKKNAKIGIGRDNKKSSKILEKALVCGINSMGADAFLIGEVTTACVSFSIKHLVLDAGIMITIDNFDDEKIVFKIFNGSGYKITDEQESFITYFMFNVDDFDMVKANEIGNCNSKKGVTDNYINYLTESNFETKFSNICLITDDLLIEKMAKHFFTNIGLKFKICNNCDELEKFDLVVKTDNNGEKLEILDSDFNVMSSQKLFVILAKSLKQNLLSTTIDYNRAYIHYLEQLGCQIFETTRLSEKELTKTMLENNVTLGADAEGKFYFLKELCTHDFFLCLKQLLLNLSPSDLDFELKTYPSFTLIKSGSNELLKDVNFKELINSCESEMLDDGRILLFNENENQLKIYVECENKNKLEKIKNILN